MLGVFAKVVLGQAVKTRLQTQLSRQEAERFHAACLADMLETGRSLGIPVTLFLQGAEHPGAVQDLGARLGECGFNPSQWEALHMRPQSGADLGERLENAIAWMLTAAAPHPCLIVGSDHPSLPAEVIRDGLERLTTAIVGSQSPAPVPRLVPDVVLGPTPDGGYWCIGSVRPIPGLLQQIPWSTAGVLHETQERARQRGLRVDLLQPWNDVDRPADLPILARQIEAHRARGDARTGRHTERLLRQWGWTDGSAP